LGGGDPVCMLSQFVDYDLWQHHEPSFMRSYLHSPTKSSTRIRRRTAVCEMTERSTTGLIAQVSSRRRLQDGRGRQGGIWCPSGPRGRLGMQLTVHAHGTLLETLS
jgi:hypothetical protein